MRLSRGTRASAVLFFCGAVVWALLGIDGEGCRGLFSPPGTCIDGATSITLASAGDTSYSLGAVDARGVTWTDILGHAVEVLGSGEGCWVGGVIDGPYPEDAVYECSSEHCPSGGCPDPCLPYHITAGLSIERSGDTTIQRHALLDYGDGWSVERDHEGMVTIEDCYGWDLHDDAFEDDYSQTDWVTRRCLLRAFNVFAYDRRSSADESPKSGWTWRIEGNLVNPHRFTNAYKQKPGHGGVFKDDPDVAPAFVFNDNRILLGPVAGSGQVQFPNSDTTTECRGNVYLWQGTQSAYEDMLAGGDSSDAGSNGERMAALVERYPKCITMFVKPSAQSSAAFRAARWDPFVDEWKADHPYHAVRP